MKNQSLNNIRLGAFVITGLLLLVVSLYMIGLNQNFFGSNFSLKVRFRDVNGLMPGNNVRFAGIQCGTVKTIAIINDTTIEVSMLIREQTSAHIRGNARASIGSEGLMGNKVIDIKPAAANFEAVVDGGMLQADEGEGINDLMGDLSATGTNARDISSDLKQTAARINNSPALNELLTDTLIAGQLRQILKNFYETSLQLKHAANDASFVINGVRNGRGAAGVLLANQEVESNVHSFVQRMGSVAEHTEALMIKLDSVGNDLHNGLRQPGSLGYILLKDSVMGKRVDYSLQNVETGTKAFSEDMEALKHNFLLRGYFKRQERKRTK